MSRHKSAPLTEKRSASTALSHCFISDLVIIFRAIICFELAKEAWGALDSKYVVGKPADEL